MPEPTDWLDQPAHFLMGFGARLLYLDLLLHRREMKQWPPANNRLPVGYVDLIMEDAYLYRTSIYWAGPNNIRDLTEYVASSRVKDMLKDMKWYMIGATCAEPFRWALVIWMCVK